MNARAMALELLMEWGRSRALADDLVERRLARQPLSPADRALAIELFYGCLRYRLALDYRLGQLVSRRPRAVIVFILQLGLYQLEHLDRIPAHAAVDEAVRLAKQYASATEANFVNAVLRRSLQSNETIVPLECRDPWVSVSHPEWLWRRWVARWGAADTQALCEWNNQPPSVYVRVNTLQANLADFPGLCYPVPDPGGLFQSAAWKRGQLYVQDPSTLRAVDLLDPQPGESVLDMCAAPGGKTTYIAQKMQNRGRLIAADASNDRLGRVAENCQRLGVTIVATLPCEGTRLDRCLRGEQFDRVLVDAPCSNTGVMRRRPDLRWRLTAAEITRLAELQRRLLQRAAEFVRPGGVLVYSTCSLEREENEAVLETFLSQTNGFACPTRQQLFPPRDQVDGAFVARLEKQ